MKTKLTLLLTAVTCVSAQASLFYWDPISGGNGHYYEPVPLGSGNHWNAAKADAEARGGYLATITSAAENQFVFSLVDSPAYWVDEPRNNNSFGPWLGGYQLNKLAEPDGNFAWVTGEPFSYSPWQSGEPRDFDNHEEYVGYAHLGSTGVRSSEWNDYPQDFFLAYVVEYTAVPEPLTGVAVTGAALLAFAAWRRRAR